MAFASILSTEAEMDAMAGENVDATGWSDENKTAWGIQAEGYLSLIGKYDFVTNVETLDSITKAVLSEYVARYTGMQGILYNMSGFVTIIEAEDMINVHAWRIEKIEQWLKNNTYTKLVQS